MGLFERYLTVWVGLGILAGVGLGLLTPATFAAIAAVEFAHVNLIVAVLIDIWVRQGNILGTIRHFFLSPKREPESANA